MVSRWDDPSKRGESRANVEKAVGVANTKEIERLAILRAQGKINANGQATGLVQVGTEGGQSIGALALSLRQKYRDNGRTMPEYLAKVAARAEQMQILARAGAEPDGRSKLALATRSEIIIPPTEVKSGDGPARKTGQVVDNRSGTKGSTLGLS